MQMFKRGSFSFFFFFVVVSLMGHLRLVGRSKGEEKKNSEQIFNEGWVTIFQRNGGNTLESNLGSIKDGKDYMEPKIVPYFKTLK